jgi:hypothetical protein
MTDTAARRRSIGCFTATILVTVVARLAGRPLLAVVAALPLFLAGVWFAVRAV